MNCTNYRTFSDMEVVNEFTGAVDLSTKNMTALVKHLTDFELSSQIEGFKEENKKVYFKVGGYWTKAGEEINPFPEPVQISKNTRALTAEELNGRLEYVELRIFALKNIIKFFKSVDFGSFRKHKSWTFNRWGSPVAKTGGKAHFPIREIRPETPFKKDLLQFLKKEKAEWESTFRELHQVQSGQGEG